MSDPSWTEAVAELNSFPLLRALFGRRSRRFGLGMAIPDGPLKYCSHKAAVPLSQLERTILVLAGCGVTGWNTGFEHTASGTVDTLCNYPVRMVGRTFASGAAAHTSEVIVTDDDGTFITQFRDTSPDEWSKLQQTPPTEWDSLLATRSARLVDKRVVVPSVAPHVASHNTWNVNKPGTTLFAPVVDVPEHALAVLAIYLGMGMVPYDAARRCTCGDLRPFLECGMLVEGRKLILQEFEQHVVASVAMEAIQICHNVALVLQAIGLGGWTFTGLNPQSMMGLHQSAGIEGFGFRFVHDERFTSPNPVGIDGVFQPAFPPYVESMRDAVRAFVARKFGPEGTFAPTSNGPYLHNHEVMSRVERYSPEFVELMTEVCSYVFDTYGRFPGSAPSIYMRPYVQAQHVDLDFYEKFFGADACLETHRRHFECWHGSERQ